MLLLAFAAARATVLAAVVARLSASCRRSKEAPLTTTPLDWQRMIQFCCCYYSVEDAVAVVVDDETLRQKL